MLRIITTETDNRQTWVLHGRLAGPLAAEFRNAWDKARAGRMHSKVDSKCVVDLTDVTFVDEAGAEVLCAMQNAGVRFIAGGVDTRHLLEGLKEKKAPSLRRCLSYLCPGERLKKETHKL